MKLLVYPAVDEESLSEIQSVSDQIECINVSDEAEALTMMPEADAMYGRITPSLLKAARRLRWIQDHTALDNFKFPELLESHVLVTSMRGVWSDDIADHAMMFILMLARGSHLYSGSQVRREWRDPAPVVDLGHSTLGIIGLGGIGTEVARRAAAFGMRVLAVDVIQKEKPHFVAELWDLEGLANMMAQSDFVVVCVPYTDQTVKLIGAEQLKQMKQSAFLVNVTRGVVVDLDALTNALQAGEIVGAGLDVFEVEPLPSDHPLWSMENVIITPHIAAVNAHGEEHSRHMNVLKENLRRFLAGEPLINVATIDHWF